MALTKVKLIADGTIVQSHLNASHGITTADIGEGSNLYYTDARARAAVSVSGNALSYNSSTGVITSNFEESPVFTGTVKGSTYLVNGTSVAGIGTSLGDINGAELGPGYLIVSRDDTASAKQISFYKNNVEHSYLETTSSGLNIGGTNVGIGTTSPSKDFVVSNSGAEGIEFDAGALTNLNEILSYNRSGAVWNTLRYSASEHQFYNSGSEKMRIDSSGNTTFTGNVMPAAENAHNIGSAAVRWEDLYVDDGFIRNAYIDEYIYHNGDTDTYIRFTPDTMTFRTAADDAITIDSNRRVGIGETSPNGKLDIKQNMTAGTTAAFTSPHLRLSANNTVDNTGFVGMTFGTSTANNYGFSWGALRTTSALGGMHLRFHNNSASGTDIFNIDYVGNVTIATQRYIRSDSSSGYLTIQGGSTYPGGRIDMYGGNNAAAGIEFLTGGATSTPTLSMRITSGGEVNMYNTLNINSPSGAGDKGIQIKHSNGNKAAELIHGGTGDEGMLRLLDNNSETVRIAGENNVASYINSGNVGIGATSPNANLQVNRNTSTANLFDFLDVVANFGNQNSNPGNHYPSGIRIYQGSGTMGSGLAALNIGVDTNLATPASINTATIETPNGMTQGLRFSCKDSNAFIRFNTDNTERMRIDSSGRMLAGTQTRTGNYDAHYFVRQADNSYVMIISNTQDDTDGQSALQLNLVNTSATTNSYFLICRQGDIASGTNRFLIYANGNAVNSNNSYGAISDSRLKENIVDATPKLDQLMQIPVKNFNLIGDDKKQIGIIAQDVEQIFPGIIDENKLPDSEDETLYKSVKYSVLVPMLLKGMQEQQDIINDLKARIEILENN